VGVDADAALDTGGGGMEVFNGALTNEDEKLYN
jgi:hypothetical protein